MQDKSQTRVSCPHGSVPGGDERAVGVIHAQRGRGRSARTPSEIPERGWKDILLRIWKNIGRDRVVVVAAGVTFYSILAGFSPIAALVSLYGFFAHPATIPPPPHRIPGLGPGG